MSRNFKSLICFILLAVMLLGCAACENGSAPEQSSTESTEPAAADLVIFENGASDYLILRGEDTPAAIVNACKTIKNAFEEATGVDIKITTDLTAEYQKTDISKAIVVGVIDDDFSAALAADLKYTEYKIAISEKRIYIAGGSNDAIAAGCTAFAEKYLSGKTERVSVSSADLPSCTAETKFELLTVNGADIKNATILYDGTQSSKDAADILKTYIAEVYGIELKVALTAPRDSSCSIYIGYFAGSSVCKNVVSKFDRSHYYWSVTAEGNELFLIGEGAYTIDAAVAAFKAALKDSSEKSLELSSLKLSGNVEADAKTELNSSTDVRVMTCNLLWSDAANVSTAKRCEYDLDTFLLYQIDVICFNEYFATPLTTLSSSMAPYYDTYFPEYEDIFNGDWTGYTNDLYKLQQHIQATPIAVRKGSGLTYVGGGFRYTSEKWWIHSITWVVLKTSSGKTFAAISNHYGDQAVGNFAKDTLKCAEDIRAKYGDIPIIICGDLYSKQGETAYSTLVNNGFKDACFNSATRGSKLGYGSYHSVGSISTGSSVPIDHIMFSSGKFDSLRYHIIINKYTKWSSDHFPIYADLKIK